jgi:hypothetical protein
MKYRCYTTNKDFTFIFCPINQFLITCALDVSDSSIHNLDKSTLNKNYTLYECKKAKVFRIQNIGELRLTEIRDEMSFFECYRDDSSHSATTQLSCLVKLKMDESRLLFTEGEFVEACENFKIQFYLKKEAAFMHLIKENNLYIHHYLVSDSTPFNGTVRYHNPLNGYLKSKIKIINGLKKEFVSYNEEYGECNLRKRYRNGIEKERLGYNKHGILIHHIKYKSNNIDEETLNINDAESYDDSMINKKFIRNYDKKGKLKLEITSHPHIHRWGAHTFKEYHKNSKVVKEIRRYVRGISSDIKYNRRYINEKYERAFDPFQLDLWNPLRFCWVWGGLSFQFDKNGRFISSENESYYKNLTTHDFYAKRFLKNINKSKFLPIK